METAPDQSGGCIRAHDLWIVSERVDLVDLFVDVPDQGVRGQVLAAVELGGSG